MDVDEARRFIAEHHHGVMAVFRGDGRPAMSPVAVGIDDQGRPLISSRETAYKVKSLRRDPRVALCVMRDQFYPPWVQIEGTATIVSLPEAMDVLVYQYRQIAGEHPDWDDYRAAMERDQRLIIRIDIERAGPDREG